MNSISEINESIGLISGRDGIYMDFLNFLNSTLKIQGEINSELCSVKHASRWIKYEITFSGVIFYKLLSPEAFSHITSSKSNIYVKDKSKIISAYDLKGKSEFVILTYDYVLEVVASQIQLNIISER